MLLQSLQAYDAMLSVSLLLCDVTHLYTNWLVYKIVVIQQGPCTLNAFPAGLDKVIVGRLRTYCTSCNKTAGLMLNGG